MGATDNAGFNAKVQQNHMLDLVTKQHKSLQAVYSFLSDMLTYVNFPYFRYGGPLL